MDQPDLLPRENAEVIKFLIGKIVGFSYRTNYLGRHPLGGILTLVAAGFPMLEGVSQLL